MVETADIAVQINKKSECIYKSTMKNEGNDLNSLISNVKSIQQKVNEILTKLVQAEQVSNQDEHLADNDDDDDDSEGDNADEEDGNSKPKKCKYK